MIGSRSQQYLADTFKAAMKERVRDFGRLDGKIALIRGGTTGIGFANAQRFVTEGGGATQV
jgi:NADP-dependent 3-hydroxy acid dehydrogenase YdfG